MNHKEYIEHLLGEGDIRAAIHELTKGAKFSRQKRLANDLLLVLGRYNRVEKDKTKGFLSYESYGVQCSRITDAIQMCLDSYKLSPTYSFTPPANFVQQTPQGNTNPQSTMEIPAFFIEGMKGQLKAQYEIILRYYLTSLKI